MLFFILDIVLLELRGCIGCIRL